MKIIKMEKELKRFSNDTNNCIAALEELKNKGEISQRSLGCLDTLKDTRDFLEPLLKKEKKSAKAKKSSFSEEDMYDIANYFYESDSPMPKYQFDVYMKNKFIEK